MNVKSFLIYTALGTLATFSVIAHLSLLPHLSRLETFAEGATGKALLEEWAACLLTLALSWIAWWSVSGLLSLVLYGLGKYSIVVLFFTSLSVIAGITFTIM